jgi:GNAT superfamily N-acetyltransferase
MKMATELTIRPLTTDRWHDLEALFAAKGCAQARQCWCMYYRDSGPGAPVPTGSSRGQMRRQALKDLVDGGRIPGLLGYRDALPVGWVSFGPRADFARLRRSPVMKPVDDVPVWSIICFTVPPAFRGQGVARTLLGGAVEFAATHGAQVMEGYPVDRHGRSSDDSMWFGPKSMFDAAGFVEIARRRPDRPIVRKVLGG